MKIFSVDEMLLNSYNDIIRIKSLSINKKLNELNNAL